MPNIARLGVSKKISDVQERHRLKDIVREHLPEGMGVIVRTTSYGCKAKDIIKDLNYLVRTWRLIEERMKEGYVPTIEHLISNLAQFYAKVRVGFPSFLLRKQLYRKIWDTDRYNNNLSEEPFDDTWTEEDYIHFYDNL